MGSLLPGQRVILIGFKVTLVTLKRLLTSVDSFVSFQSRSVSSLESTLVTPIRLLACMGSLVPGQSVIASGFEITLVTLKGLLTSVDSYMTTIIFLVKGFILACITNINLVMYFSFSSIFLTTYAMTFS